MPEQFLFFFFFNFILFLNLKHCISFAEQFLNRNSVWTALQPSGVWLPGGEVWAVCPLKVSPCDSQGCLLTPQNPRGYCSWALALHSACTKCSACGSHFCLISRWFHYPLHAEAASQVSSFRSPTSRLPRDVWAVPAPILGLPHLLSCPASYWALWRAACAQAGAKGRLPRGLVTHLLERRRQLRAWRWSVALASYCSVTSLNLPRSPLPRL